MKLYLEEWSRFPRWHEWTFAHVKAEPLYHFHELIPPFFLNFHWRLCDLGSASVWSFFFLHYFSVVVPPLPPANDLCDDFLLCPTLCFYQNREYMAQSQLSLKSYDVSSVKEGFRLIQSLYMTVYVRVGLMTGHCTSHKVPHFLQMLSIEEARHAAGRCREVVTIAPLP